MDENPYQAPVAQDLPPPAIPISNAEEVRRDHIGHEASLKSLGFLYYLGGIVILCSLVGVFSALSAGSGGLGAAETAYIALPIAMALVQFFAGWGLRRLAPWSRIVAGILSVFGLVYWPVGTIISAYSLYLIFSAKGRMIFSPQYREIVAQTPHVKYKSGLFKLLLVVLLIVVIAVGIVYYLYR